MTHHATLFEDVYCLFMYQDPFEVWYSDMKLINYAHCYLIFPYLISGQVILYHVMSCHVMSCHVMSCHVMS